MGNWNISISGVGCHHNGAEYDVEQLAAKFVDELKKQGHTVTTADVTMGSKIDALSRFGLLEIKK